MDLTTHRIDHDIAVTVRTPDDAPDAPVVILCHGFCGIQEILLPAFAERFAAAGFIAATFDYRGFGASGGERGRLVPALQIDDIRTMIGWARTGLGSRKNRIGLWGTSLGGCHAVVAAANDPDIGCVVSQMPFADGEQLVTGRMSDEEKRNFVSTLDKMEAKRRDTGKEMMVGVNRVLTDDESKAFFEDAKARFPAADIRIPFLTVRETMLYKPGDAAAAVSCPTLVVVAENDAVNPPEQGTALFQALGAKQKALHVEPDARHYALYDGPHFENVVARQIDWFRQHL